MKNKFVLQITTIIGASLVLRFIDFGFIESESRLFSIIAILIALSVGTYVIFLISEIIEETTVVLRHRTGLAGGLIQAVGTALPDMIVGVTAALMSIQTMSSNYALSISYAIIAASATFGSNIYNMGFAAYCISRQNIANKKHKDIRFIPLLGKTYIKPMDEHECRPNLIEVNTSIRVIASLSVLTALIAILMVMFGKSPSPTGFSGELYGLKPLIGLAVMAIAVTILIKFSKNYSEEFGLKDNFFQKFPTFSIWFLLFICAGSIFLTAETMVEAVSHACILFGIPVVIGGTLAGIIGCLAEMIVVYKFTVNPMGRIGDAVVGVAMDNIITIIGASIVAIIGGIFLGGSSLIIIFMLILTVNMLLVWQVSELKDFYTEMDHFKKGKTQNVTNV
jgi:hypothetical protein